MSDMEIKHVWSITSPEEEEKFKDANPRKIYNSLATVFTEEEDDVFKTRAGHWMAKTKGNRDYSILNTLIVEGGEEIKVVFKENIRGNTCTGEIEHSSYIYSTEDEISEELKQKNATVISVRKNRRWVQGHEVETGTVVITFNGRERPRSVEIFGRVRETTEHIPKPKRCTKCQQFRHIRRFCTFATSVCARCSEAHETRECTATYRRCINCNGDHWASSWDCPKYKKEQQIEEIRERERTTYRQADYKLSMVNKPKEITHNNVYEAEIQSSAGRGGQNNVWARGRPSSDSAKKFEDLSVSIAELTKQIRMQSEVICLQANILFKVVSKSIFLNTDTELKGDLKRLAKSYEQINIVPSAEENDSDSDSDMVFEEEKQEKNKRKIRGSDNDQHEGLSKKQLKKLKKKQEEEKKSVGSRHTSDSREASSSVKDYLKDTLAAAKVQ